MYTTNLPVAEISSQNAKIIFILFTSYLLLPRTVEKLCRWQKFKAKNAKIIFILFTSYLLLPRTVEKLWKITEELNILYKDNWTSLADREIAIFQTELLASGLVSNPDQSGTKC